MTIELILAAVCALTFFRAGRLEADSGGRDDGALWALLSASLSALLVLAFDASWLVLLACQVGLFFGIGVYRALRDPA